MCLKKCTVKKQLLFCNCVLCLVVVCRKKNYARANQLFYQQINIVQNQPLISSSSSISFFSQNVNVHRKKILFLLLVRGSVACAPAPARRKTGIYYYGCVFIILINNGKNSYYYTLEYMKQRLFGKNVRARRKFRRSSREQENMQ